ncbi:NUDIX hydrolase [Aureibacillus halotolerans]|uniref:NUDIX domain-containing protein n=1 Tax=Aureibacillus halotolerans TaxID=1508390 RepID=A0A4R6UBI6_9BACI|nr:NUDIX hydrolase [Aureibacillus halotolerans]TDQ40454.1 NUDIX domain-containing protein [Aureibacillus halotolerans]
MSDSIQIRVTGILIEVDKIVLVKQTVSPSRNWSLPGGRLEQGESLETALIREFLEETGLSIEVIKLLYVCEVPTNVPAVIHVSFLVKRISGEIKLPTNEFDENPISDVQMVSINHLERYGFSEKFIDMVNQNFPNSGSYMGLKKNIGL